MQASVRVEFRDGGDGASWSANHRIAALRYDKSPVKRSERFWGEINRTHSTIERCSRQLTRDSCSLFRASTNFCNGCGCPSAQDRKNTAPGPTSKLHPHHPLPCQPPPFHPAQPRPPTANALLSSPRTANSPVGRRCLYAPRSRCLRPPRRYKAQHRTPIHLNTTTTHTYTPRANVGTPTCPALWPWFLRFSLSTQFPETQSITFELIPSFGGSHPIHFCGFTALSLGKSSISEVSFAVLVVELPKNPLPTPIFYRIRFESQSHHSARTRITSRTTSYFDTIIRAFGYHNGVHSLRPC
jgi:hypothetical protein